MKIFGENGFTFFRFACINACQYRNGDCGYIHTVLATTYIYI